MLTLTTSLVLRALLRGVRFGFDIMDHTGLPSGTVYPVLRRLERGGQVTSKWESELDARRAGRPPRRYYALTERGRELAAEAIQRYRAAGLDWPSATPEWEAER